jgi:hypothetical protein
MAPTPSYSAARQGPHQPSNGLGVPDPDASQEPNGPLGPLVERSTQQKFPKSSPRQRRGHPDPEQLTNHRFMDCEVIGVGVSVLFSELSTGKKNILISEHSK